MELRCVAAGKTGAAADMRSRLKNILEKDEAQGASETDRTLLEVTSDSFLGNDDATQQDMDELRRLVEEFEMEGKVHNKNVTMLRQEKMQDFLKGTLVIARNSCFDLKRHIQFKRRLKCPHCKKRNGKLRNDNSRALILDFSGTSSEKKKKKEAERKKKEREVQEKTRQLLEEGAQPDFEQTVLSKNLPTLCMPV